MAGGKYRYSEEHTLGDGTEFCVPSDIIEWVRFKSNTEDKSHEWQKIIEAIDVWPGKPLPKAYQTKKSAVNYFRRIMLIMAENDQEFFMNRMPPDFIYNTLGMAFIIKEGGKILPEVVDGN